jgi:hypothetical protein
VNIVVIQSSGVSSSAVLLCLDGLESTNRKEEDSDNCPEYGWSLDHFNGIAFGRLSVVRETRKPVLTRLCYFEYPRFEMDIVCACQRNE